MRKEVHGRCRGATSGERRMLRAAVVFGAVAAIGAGNGIVPVTHSSVVVPRRVAAPAVSLMASVADADAETAAIELLKATYFNDVDTKNWAALRRLFSPDAVVDTTGSSGPYFPSRDPFIVFTALTLSAINTRHQGYDPDIELTSDTTASAVWTMQDRLSLAGLVTIHGSGHYTDRYEKVNGEWVVTYSKLTRTGYALEFTAFDKFVAGIKKAYNEGGPVAALLQVVPGLVEIPVSVARNLVGALASNFGGPAAKADAITVPEGSTGVTTEPPGGTARTSSAVADSTSASSGKTVTLKTTARTAGASGAKATSSAAEATEGTTKPIEASEATEGTTKSQAPTAKPAKEPRSAIKTTDDTSGAGSSTTTESTGQNHSSGSSSTSPDGAGHKSADGAESKSSESSGES